MSADDSLRPHGAQTGIDWQADLEKYINYLQSGLDKRKASVLTIFRMWDEIFFPASDTGLGGKASDNDGERRMQDVMELLNADDDEAVQEESEADH